MKYGILKYLKKVKTDGGDEGLESVKVGKCKLKIMSLFKSELGATLATCTSTSTSHSAQSSFEE